jgi:hypothetical protein
MIEDIIMMIKKALRFSMIAAGIALSTSAFAVDTVTAIGPGGSTTISNVNDCSALANDVTVQLSDNVNAAYLCTSTSVIAGACHGKGTNKSQDFDCTYTPTDDGSGGTIYLTPTGCAAWDGTGTAPVGTYTNSGVVGFRGGSGGGTVGVVGMGVTICNATTVLDLVQ